MRRKIRLTESSLRAMVSESVRRVLSEIVGPSDKYPRNVSADMASNLTPIDGQANSFHELGKKYIARGLEKSNLRHRWNAKYREIGKMDVFGSIDLTDDWARRLGVERLDVSWFGNAPEENETNHKMRRRLAEWDAEGILPKGAVMLLAKVQDYI